MKLWVDIARQRNWSAESGADARCWMMTSVVGRLRRANEILTTASAFSRHGSARHGVDGRVRRRVQGPFQGRDRPRPGDERHAGTGNPRRAPRRDTRHRQTGEGRGRRARPRGTRVRDGAPNPPHRPRAAGHRNGPKPGITRTKRRKPPHYKSGTKTGHINVPDGTFAPPLVRLCGPVVSACRRTAPGRSRRRTRGSQPDARPSATASGRSSPE